jgi:predicted nucleic acid-binding Zn ribbon protein
VKPERIGDEIRRELGRFGPAAGMADIVTAWPGLAGEQIARNAWPARLARDGTLHVATSSSAWAFELAQLAPELLERLRSALGEAAPRGLRFAPGKLPDAAEATPWEAERKVPDPSAEHLELAAALTDPIEDESLREVVAKTAAQSLARADDDRSV